MPRASLKQRKDGRYCAVYKGVHFMGDTQSEAFAKRDTYKKQIEAGMRSDAAGILFSQYADQWVRTYKHSASLSTQCACARILNAFISIVGDKPLRDVVPTDIQRVYNEQEGFSKSHISKCAQTFRAMFASAVADRIIPFSPCLAAKAPNGTAGTHRAITEAERNLILESVGKHRFAPAAMVMLYAGLRRGEVLALDVDRDVDFDTMTITVREAVRFDGNHAEIADPKTEAGKRTVPMLDILADTLQDVHGLVAPSASGEHMSEIAFKRAWEGFVSCLEVLSNRDTKRWYGRRTGQGEAWLQDHPWKPVTIRPHDLRHSYCTMLYDSGIDLKTAQKWMGHADQSMTIRIYTHLTAEREEESARLLREKVNEKMQNDVQRKKDKKKSIV